jgi:hypothetical protein
VFLNDGVFITSGSLALTSRSLSIIFIGATFGTGTATDYGGFTMFTGAGENTSVFGT